jgi:hypothetical protein
VRKAHLLGVLFILLVLATAASAQTSFYTRTDQISGSALQTNGPFDGCNGDTITLDGTFTETTNQWVDANGSLHTRTQIVSSAITATGSTGISYDVIFSQKLVETVTDAPLTPAETQTFRLKLLGPGPLNNQFVFMDVHVTFPQGDGTGPFVDKNWTKCTG